jgi:hypothetical protein
VTSLTVRGMRKRYFELSMRSRASLARLSLGSISRLRADLTNP